MKVLFLFALFGIFSNSQCTKIPCGTPALKGEFPYLASLQYNNRHLCGASVISANKVVTAAHCCEVGGAASFKVIAGVHSLSTPSEHEQIRQVSRAIIHPQYSSSDLSNDVCVLTLSNDLDLSSAFVQPVELASPVDDPSGNAVYPAWGAQGSTDKELYKFIVPILTNAKCREAYGVGQITNSMICAQSHACDNCNGNSGVPLVSEVDGRNKLIGISSWGYGCSRPEYPNVYTRISSVST